MHILVRADASVEMGTGHIMRCLTLADELRRRGADIHFVTRAHAGHLAELIANKGYSVTLLPFPAEPYHRSGDEPAHADWLGVNWEEDVRETRTALEQIGGVDWLVVDHYALDHRWETALRPLTKRLFVIDDLADRIHDCDVLLDQNLQPEDGNRYAGLVSDTCRLLLGPRFALLRPEFREARKNLRPRDGKVRRILIFFGGTDPHNLTALALEAVRSLHREDISVDVVVGSGNPRREAIRETCETMPSAVYHCQTDDMAGLMARADLAIGASGSSTWERCCLGLPTVLMYFAANQIQIAQSLASRRAAIKFEMLGSWGDKSLKTILSRLLDQHGLVKRISRQTHQLTDGAGTSRCLAAMGFPLRIHVVSDAGSWINALLSPLLDSWRQQGYRVTHSHNPYEVLNGDLAFFLSCSHIIGREILFRNAHNLVIHESDLPKGRGWSPLSWQILQGQNRITTSLFEATERVDSGDIYLKNTIPFSGHELVDELRRAQADVTIRMCLEFVTAYPEIIITAVKQCGTPTYYPRRTPQDSSLNPDQSLREQFNLLRVVDNDRYPAFMEIQGYRYIIRIVKDGH